MGKRTRHIIETKAAIEYLTKVKKAPLRKIVDYINENTKQGTNRYIMCNVLRNDKRFIVIGKVRMEGNDNNMWSLREETS